MRLRPVLLTIALLLLIPATAFADGGNVMGSVYVDDQPAADICVEILDGDNAVATQKTNAGGDYSIYVATPGWYTVKFGDCGVGYTSTQFSNAEVVSDQDTPNVNGYLSSAGRVSGNVKDTLNAVLTGACVKAEDQNGLPIAETTTDGNGDYVLGGLPYGETRIHFEGCSAGNYVRSTDTPVMVQTGETTSGIDGVLTPAGRLSGHVQNANGDPLPNMCVGGWAADRELSNVVTDSNGDYVIREVPPSGAYELSAYDCFGGTYMNHQRSGQLAGAVNQVVDFTLPRPGHIVGHVRDEAGVGLASICVTASNPEGNDRAVAQTDVNGYYELNQIRPGTWDISFNASVSEGEESACSPSADWVPATTTGVVLGDGETLWDVDRTLRHPAPADPPAGADPGAGGALGAGPDPGGASGPGGSGEPVASGSSGGGSSADPRAASCKAPKLVGLKLAKAKKRLRAAHCKLGKVTRAHSRSHARKGTVVRQKRVGTKVALTVAK